MKIKYLMPILLIVFVFSLISCTPKVSSQPTTTSEIPTTIVETTISPTTITENTTPATTTKEVTETTVDMEDAKNAVKEAYIDLIENIYNGKVTKFIISGSLLMKIIVSYNTQWASEDTVKKELFDITTAFTVGENPPSFDLELSATTKMGDVYNTATSKGNLIKMQNLEMSYEDWLSITFK